MSTWEERMAEKAALRKGLAEAQERQHNIAEHEAEQEAWIAEYADSLTVEKALAEQKWFEENPFGCACVGGPFCCQIRRLARERVLNA